MADDGAGAARTVVWVVDDVEPNHQLVRRSLPEGFEAICDLVCYLAPEDALADLDVGFDADPTMLPDVVFMDFFLGSLYGNEVTVKMRKAFADRGLRGPYIVGHSSAYPASLEIVRAGGDVAIAKDRHARISPGIQGLFPDRGALESYAGRASRPQEVRSS